MNWVLAIVQFLVAEIFSKPFYLVGLMTGVGLIALRRSSSQVIAGTIKATMGFLILGVGAGTVINALDPLGKLLVGATGVRGVVPTNEAIVALAQTNYGALTAWLMFIGFIARLVIARSTNLRYVFLPGRHIFYMATLLAVIMVAVGMAGVGAVIIGAILLGTIMVIMPAFAHPWMKAVTGGEKVAMGHFGSLGYIAGGITGQYVTRVAGKKGKSSEEIEFPAGLRFLREPMVGTAVAMLVIYVVFAVWYAGRGDVGLAGAAKAVGLSASATWGSYLMAQLINALNFGVGVAVILLGVRTIIGEIVPAFAGIAERVVPGALPALDCPVSFPYAPNAVLIGFLTSVLGGLISLLLIAWGLGKAWVLALILPGMVPHFFTGGTAGVFGNATGGRWGAAWGGFVNGILITFLPAFLLKVLGALGFANTTFGDADFGWYGIVVGNIAQVKGAAGAIGVVLAAIVLIVFASWFQKNYVEKGWVPGKAAGRAAKK